MNQQTILRGAISIAALSALASAQILVSSNITTSTTWTSNNVYRLTTQVFVEPGATLTIQPGTVIEGVNDGALAICRGAQIFANGTAENPIVFTSPADRATWTGGNPRTGTYRPNATGEWGAVALMGRGYISENQIPTNTPAPNGANYADLEGLTPANVTLNDYGGNDDNDDSGSVRHVSIRYCGITVTPGVELNGLAMGGVGRNTDVEFIEVLNCIDDGIEIWGGTVNVKHFSLWNIGDDGLDVDQGWRGKAQFGLIVQGGMANSQGSGFSDNAIEIDGAERCDYQPVTTATLYNLTVIGAPPETASLSNAGDHLTAWRDNANVQIRNSIFMDAGDNVVNNDVSDFENGNLGYGCNGTLSWAARWTTPYTVTSTVNPFAAPELTPAQAYTVQTSGNLIDFRDNIFFRNIRANAYTEANARNVFSGGGGTANANNAIVTNSPVTTLNRGPFQNFGALRTANITFLDPLPQNEALTAAEFAPNDGFFTSARFRGAFPQGNNWLFGWTATSAFGLTPSSSPTTYIPTSRPGATGASIHYTTGTWAANTNVTNHVTNIDPALSIGIFVFGFSRIDFPIFGGTLIPSPDFVDVVVGSGGAAQFGPWTIPPGAGGTVIWTQVASFDTSVPSGEFAFSNAQRHILP
jgi:hypothetical protein